MTRKTVKNVTCFLFLCFYRFSEGSWGSVRTCDVRVLKSKHSQMCTSRVRLLKRKKNTHTTSVVINTFILLAIYRRMSEFSVKN